MKKRLFVLSLIILLLFVIGCEDKNSTTEPIISKESIEQIKATIPLDERRFIYYNTIKIEQKDINTTDEKKIVTRNYYPIISGLKDKLVQDNINRELEAVGKELLSQFEADFLEKMQDHKANINAKNSNANIFYNFNNVIFVEYSVYIEAVFKDENYYPSYKSISIGYDLNTGEEIQLDDIFKPGSDYKSKINNFISQYIIENNYDDYEYERMTKPFQGIKEDQSFSFGIEGLRIILDEKNDEFFLTGYQDSILIPLKYLGDDLYIYDKFFDEGISIFDTEKHNKKLFPNNLEFKANNMIREGNEKYFIEITEGEFINVPDKDIQEKLNKMVALKIDIDSYRKKINALEDKNTNSRYGYYVNVFANAGGYLSIATSEDIYFDNKYELNRRPFNYDFNLNKEMLLSELFNEGTNISYVIKNYIKKAKYPVTDEMIEIGVEESVEANNFYFDEYGVVLYFSPEGSKLDDYMKWVWVPFEDFGMENIKLFN